MTERAKALAKGMYHMAHAKQYFEAFKIEAEQAGRNNVKNWLNKISFIENDAMSIMSDESREYFRKEIRRGDVLFIGAVSWALLELTQENRDKVEELVLKMVKLQELEEQGVLSGKE